MADGFDSQLLAGVAALLADEIDDLTWNPSGVYGDTDTGIVRMRMPASPDRVVALFTYSLGDDATYADSTKGLQVRCRGQQNKATDALDLDAAIFDVLAGRWPVTIGGIQVQTVLRRSSVPLGIDANQRPEHSSNYEFGLYQPGTHRL